MENLWITLGMAGSVWPAHFLLGKGHPEARKTLCHSHPSLGFLTVTRGHESGCPGSHGGVREGRDREGRRQASPGKV